MKKAEQYSRKYLDREIRAIENSPRKNEDNGLSVYEKALIYKYSNDGFEYLNEQLRLNAGRNDSEFGKLLNQSLSKLPDFEGLVYRGANLTTDEIQVYKDALANSQAVTEPCFISTSKSRLMAMQFRGNTLFRMYSNTGKDIERIAKFGLHDPANEKEVLFRPNCSFRVLDVTNEAGYTLITVEEV